MHKNDVIILGGGLAGLSAAYTLAKAGKKVTVYEHDSEVGGLSKTVVRGEFRFDLGGHRFFSKNDSINSFVKNLLKGELISVERSSKIYLRGKYFDYPLRTFNAMAGLGFQTSINIMSDYVFERVRRLIHGSDDMASLEDWVVGNFGRTMFDIYFKVYSEKVWGIPCNRISAAWVDQRINGLSLPKAVKNALFKLNGKAIPTLVDRFLYPELGIGRISDRLREDTEEADGKVMTDSRVERINHSDFRISSVVVNNRDHFRLARGADFVSSIPVTKLVRMLMPPAPDEIQDAATKLRYRDLVVVAVMVKRARVTDLTWIYVPEQHIPFGRIHEPTNWSTKMSPDGKTLLVTEYFSFRGDHIWALSDDALSGLTIRNLEQLGFITEREVMDSVVIRVPKAYPLFEVGHEHYCEKIHEYLSRFHNLYISGRTGMFKYYNMDHAIESGIRSAEEIMKNTSSQAPSGDGEFEPIGNGVCVVR